MQLESRQLSTLEKIGIPIWELRQRDEMLLDHSLDEQQLHATCLLMYDTENHTTQKQQLLEAILASIDIKIEVVDIIRKEQFLSLNTMDLGNRLILVFGQQLMTPALKNKKDENIQLEIGPNIIVVPSLSELIGSAEKKQQAWQALKSAKIVLENRV
jgi:DNA polymerase III psi subunit